VLILSCCDLVIISLIIGEIVPRHAHRNTKIDQTSCTDQAISIIRFTSIFRSRDGVDSGSNQERLSIVETNKTQSWEDDRSQGPSKTMKYGVE